jgi:ADP-ribose pyrophosphatase YjhB (NUDIX family)
VSDGAPSGRRTRIGAYAVSFDDLGRVLLCRLADGPAAGLWTLPGGGIEFGEHPDAAVLRELGEETGLRGRIDEIMMIDARVLPSDETPTGEELAVIGIVYRVAIVGSGEPRVEVDGSTDACGWFTTADAEALDLVPFAREAIRRTGAVAAA